MTYMHITLPMQSTALFNSHPGKQQSLKLMRDKWQNWEIKSADF